MPRYLLIDSAAHAVDLLDQADLPETFQVVVDDPPMEQEYGND
ncbi:hypothetical protein [Nocardioides allogilvus]|nr:hypothetical protein [Nocardioides allogilvus]